MPTPNLPKLILLLLAADGGVRISTANLLMRAPLPTYSTVRVHCDNGATPRLESRGAERWVVCDARPDGGV